MILSYQIPEWHHYQRAAFALHDVEREIENRRNSKHQVERKILPSLIAKRDRIAAEIAPLKAAYEAAEQRAVKRLLSPVVSSALATPSTTQPSAAGTDHLDIPAFLRRQSK